MSARGTSRWPAALAGAGLLVAGIVALRPGPVIPPPVTLVAGGDVMFGRGVARELARPGAAGPFDHVAGVLRGADLAFANLECPLSARWVTVPKVIAFKAAPECATLLREAGLDIVSFANNHSLDCGRPGLVETLESLEAAGVRWCGAGRTRAESERPVIFAIRGRRVAFVGFSEFLMEAEAAPDRPAVATARGDAVHRIVGAARGQAEHVVASFHWGAEYRDRPTRFQRRMARAAIAAGADLVLGHHPHVLQGLEWLTLTVTGGTRQALIAYSLGNFLFDQKDPRTRRSGLLHVTFGRGGVLAAELRPLELIACRPRPARPDVAREITLHLAGLVTGAPYLSGAGPAGVRAHGPVE